MLANGVHSSGQALLARAVAEVPDVEGAIMLVKIDPTSPLSVVTVRTIKAIVTDEIPSDSWKGAFEIVPVPAIEFRKQLLALTEGGPRLGVAARCLNMIDEIRDDYGTPPSEPRHPDLASGLPWPIIPVLKEPKSLA